MDERETASGAPIVLFLHYAFDDGQLWYTDLVDLAQARYADLSSREEDFRDEYRDRVNQAIECDFDEVVTVRTRIKPGLSERLEPALHTTSRLLSTHTEITGEVPKIEMPLADEDPRDTACTAEDFARDIEIDEVARWADAVQAAIAQGRRHFSRGLHSVS